MANTDSPTWPNKDIIMDMKAHTPEMIEGSEAFTRFRNTMKAVLAVPHSVIKEHIEEHKKQSALNPIRYQIPKFHRVLE